MKSSLRNDGSFDKMDYKKRRCSIRYLWTEDNGAWLRFRKLVNQLFFNDELMEINCIIIHQLIYF